MMSCSQMQTDRGHNMWRAMQIEGVTQVTVAREVQAFAEFSGLLLATGMAENGRDTMALVLRNLLVMWATDKWPGMRKALRAVAQSRVHSAPMAQMSKRKCQAKASKMA